MAAPRYPQLVLQQRAALLFNHTNCFSIELLGRFKLPQTLRQFAIIHTFAP